MRMSPDADRILSLPHARHSALTGLCRKLAGLPQINVADAEGILDAACQGLRITSLDLEMMQPDAVVAVPFAMPSNGPADDHNQLVAHHVRTLTVMKGGKA